MNREIRLFWWNQKPNFGDAISPEIVEYVSGRKVVWASPAECELVAVGSLMGMAANAIDAKLGPPKTIWGTGCFGPNPRFPAFTQSGHVDIRLVRGPLTGMFCGIHAAFGDPGLLADRVYGKTRKSNGIGVVLHHSQWSNKKLIQIIEDNSSLFLIDVRASNPGEVIRQIAGCEYVVSSSLHGLIIADSYKIPNAWMVGAPAVHSDLKFYDYALSIGRRMLKPSTLSECLMAAEALSFYSMSYLDEIENIKDQIQASFSLG